MVENWQRQCWRILLHLSLYFVFPCIWGEIGKVWATTKPQRATSDPTCCLVLAARWTWQVCFGSSQETNVVQVGWINFIQVGNDINSLPSKTSTFKIATKTFFVMFFPKWKDIVYGWSMLNHVDPQFSRFFAFFCRQDWRDGKVRRWVRWPRAPCDQKDVIPVVHLWYVYSAWLYVTY